MENLMTMIDLQWDYVVGVVREGATGLDVMFRLLLAFIHLASQTGLSITSELYPATVAPEPKNARRIALQYIQASCFKFVMFVQLIGFDPTKLYLHSITNTTVEVCVRMIGVSFMTLGVIGSIWTRYARGQTWASAGRLPTDVQDHELITSGPYGVVRHPFYLCSWLTVLGFQLAMFSGLVLIALPILRKNLSEARREDKELEQTYGEEYPAYKTRTPFFFPF